MTPRIGMPRCAAVAALFALLFAASLPAPAVAAGQFGIGVFGSWNTYAMDDLNDEFIGPLNDSLATAGSTAELDEVDGGIGFGGGIRYQSGTNLLFALDYEHLTAKSDVTEDGVTFEVDVPASAVTATLTYLLASTSSVRFGFAGGLGYYSSAGTLSLSDGSSSLEADVEGSGIGYHAGGVLDAALSDQAHLNIFAGWRQAKTSDLEVDDEPVLTGDGDDATLDWSGVTVKVGLNFFFGMTGAE